MKKEKPTVSSSKQYYRSLVVFFIVPIYLLQYV